MQRICNKALLVLFTFSLMANLLSAISFDQQKKVQMIQDLEVLKHHLEVGYAPAIWKKEYVGWDLEAAFDQAKNQILDTPSITTKQFQRIVCHFAKSMQDYHVNVLFTSTELASLPFSVKGVNGRYFINWIDSLRLPASYYALSLGDELLQFDGRPAAEVMGELKNACQKSNPHTDDTYAEMKLTLRLGAAGDIVPKGPILIQTRSVSGKISSFQIKWAYSPEHVKNSLDFMESLDFLSKFFQAPKSKNKLQLPEHVMASSLHQLYAKRCAERDGSLGARKSYLPQLGTPVWIKDDDEFILDRSENSNAQLNEDLEHEINWYAYIYNLPQGNSIGYIRIPHYMGFNESADKFGEIIQHMQENTEALVIDQLHNFGGFVSFQYDLISMLTTEPLKTPYHHVKITQKEAMEAFQSLKIIKFIDLMFEGISDGDGGNDSKDESVGKDQREFNYQQILFLKDYYELILEEWNAGHTLTRATPILGIDLLNPHPQYQYTKPILMLIDEMDFSGGDFIPAILQDNKRATLFGCRTAGAGGFVRGFEFPNCHGISTCSYTASIAERVNLQKIENLGVTPDIEYNLTVEDLTNNFQGYINAVNQAVQALLENSPK